MAHRAWGQGAQGRGYDDGKHKMKIEELRLLKYDMIELWNSFQKIRGVKKSDLLKFKSTMKKYTESNKMKSSFKRNLEELKEKSDMFEN